METGSRARSRRHVVSSVEDFPPGTTRAIEVRGRSICVLNHDGRFAAMRNICPHHGAPLCAGAVGGTMRPSEPQVYEFGDDPGEIVLRCPWHGYEFRLDDGRALAMPDRMAVRTYRVEVEDDAVVLYV